MSTRTEEKLPPRFRLMNRNLITIILVNGEKVLLPYTKSSYLSEAFDEVCRMTGVIDKDLFGLAQEIDGFYHYLNLSNKVSKINFKSTRKKTITSKKQRPIDSNVSSASDLSQVNSGSLGPHLYFRVKFYVRAHTLRDRQTKHQYYEQLRHNYLRYPFAITDEQALSLASLILQADHGPYHPGRHKNEYFVLDRCMPSWCLKRFDQSYLRRHLPALHSSHGRMTQSEAEFRFVRVVDAQPNYYNMHLVAALDRTTSLNGEPIWLGISPIGLELYAKRSDSLLVHMSTLVWQQIKKITYKKRLVVVQVGTSSRELRLDAQSSSVAEHLFWLCRQMHLYQITAQMRAPRSIDALDAQLAIRNGYRESYVYSDQADLQQHGSMGRGSHASRPSSVIQFMPSPNSSMVATNTFPRVPKRKPDVVKFGNHSASETKPKESSGGRPQSRKGEKRLRKDRTATTTTTPSIYVSSPNLTSGYMETDIDSARPEFYPSPEAPSPPPISSLPPASDDLCATSVTFSTLKQRALSCDGSTPFLHPEVRKLQENRALSSSLPLLTQLCRDPDLVHLLGVHDDSLRQSEFDNPNSAFGLGAYHNNNNRGRGKMSNGYSAGGPTAGMKSWRSEVLHLDKLVFDDDDQVDDGIGGDSVMVRDLGGMRDHSESSAYSFHFRDNDYINLRPNKQVLLSPIVMQNSLA